MSSYCRCLAAAAERADHRLLLQLSHLISSKMEKKQKDHGGCHSQQISHVTENTILARGGARSRSPRWWFCDLTANLCLASIRSETVLPFILILSATCRAIHTRHHVAAAPQTGPATQEYQRQMHKDHTCPCCRCVAVPVVDCSGRLWQGVAVLHRAAAATVTHSAVPAGGGGLFGGLFGKQPNQQQQQQQQQPATVPAQPAVAQQQPGTTDNPEFPPYQVLQKGTAYDLRFYEVFPVVECDYQRREQGYLALGSYQDGANSSSSRFGHTQPVVMSYHPNVSRSAGGHHTDHPRDAYSYSDCLEHA